MRAYDPISPLRNRRFLAFLVLVGLAAGSPAAFAQDGKDAINLTTAIAQIAKNNIPAVAHIEVTQRQSIPNPLFSFEDAPFFRYFFDLPRMPKEFKRESKGIGSGMVMDAAGHILTNYHVVAGATEIEVLMENGESFPAKLVGVEPQTDLAVIKINADKPLPHVTFGDSDKMEVGDWVVAIGHPRGLDHTVTQGIISAKHRRGILNPSSYQDFIQTDAAINPGNSGGPLLNLRGEVIGVNAAIVSQSGGFEGIGFAIPSNMALYAARQLISDGKVSRGWLGVNLQDLNPSLARSFKMETLKGALVADVTKGGPADMATIRRGDVITAYDGTPINDSSELRNQVAASKIGSTAQMTVWRNGKELVLPVQIGSPQEATNIQSLSIRGKLGADLKPAGHEELSKFGLKSGQGLVIAWIDPNGPLGQAGFEVNDLILEMNGHPINDLNGFYEQISSLRPHRRVTLLAIDHRSGRTGYVQVPVD